MRCGFLYNQFRQTLFDLVGKNTDAPKRKHNKITKQHGGLMIHNRALKVLSNLVLLVVFCTGQAAAAPNNSVNKVGENSSTPLSSSSAPDNLMRSSELPKQQAQAASSGLTRISGDAGGDHPSISIDGHYVAFESAGNIIIHDRQSNTPITVGPGSYPSLSANGLFVAYISSGNIMIYDVQKGTPPISVGSGSSPSISSNGHYLVFESSGNIMIYDVQQGLPSTSVGSGLSPSISADGHYVAFIESSSNGIVVRDMQTNTNVLVNTTAEDSLSPVISGDGHYVAYITWGSWDTGNDVFLHDIWTPTNQDVLVFDQGGLRLGGTITISADGHYIIMGDYGTLLSYNTLTNKLSIFPITSPDGSAPNGGSYSPSISADGLHVAFSSDASNLVAGDTNGVRDVFVTNVPTPITLAGIEVTQVVQDLNNSVTLIADKPTYVRAHVKRVLETAPNVTVSLSAYRNGILLGTLKPDNLNGGYINVKESLLDLNMNPPDTRELRAKLEESFYFKIPKSWEGAGTIKFKVNEVNQPIICAEQDPNDALNNCEVIVDFVEGPVPQINFYGVSSPGHVPDENDIKKARHQILQTFPIRNLSWKYLGDVGYPQPTSDPEMFKILGGIKILGLFDDCRSRSCFNVGVLIDYPNNGIISGLGIGSSAISFLADFAPINFGHEVGHISGRPHTICSGAEFPPVTPPFPFGYPYPGGKISLKTTGNDAFYGFDTSLVPQSLNDVLPKNIYTDRIYGIYGPDTGDMMSYCNVAPPLYEVWPSNWTYEKILESLSSRWPQSETMSSPLQSSVIVTGFVDNSQGLGNLDSIYTLESNPTISTSGTYVIRFEDVSSQEIASYNFEPEFSGEAPDFGAFTLTLPWDSNTARIVMLNPSGAQLDSRTVSNNAPVVTVISPNGGESLSGATATISWSASDADNDTLKYVIQYSNDGGNSWRPLAVDYPNTTLDLDLTSIAGGDSSLIRVIANDGILTSQDQSDAVFSVAKKAPQTEIDTHDAAVFSGDQTITLEGSGNDMEDGQLPDSSLQWSSNLDGVLGQGESISINAQQLTEGTHTITLTAQDSDLQTGTASITIHVYREFSSLSADTTPLNFTAQQGGPVTTGQFIPVWHLGNHSVTWSATANQSWIKLNPTSNNTPSDLTVSADPTGLSIGTYTGTITITSNAEGVNLQTVQVTLEVQAAPLQSKWNTFLGGSGNDDNHNMVRDANGYIYVSGASSATWGSPIHAYSGTGDRGDDVFVAKLDPSGRLVWNTFLGGALLEDEFGITVDGDGNVYVVGSGEETWGSNIRRSYSVGLDVFAAKLSPNGDLLWNTFLGGGGWDQASWISYANGNVYVTGVSGDTGWGAPINAYTAGIDGFVAKLDAGSGDLIWHTFMGGSGTEISASVNTDGIGNVYVTGYSTASWGSPGQAFTPSEYDGFIVKLNPLGARLWNTFLGGDGLDTTTSVDTDSNGDLYLSGRSSAAWGDPITAFSGSGINAYVAKMDPSWGTLTWHSFIGGSGDDVALRIAMDESNNINIVGGSTATWGSPLRAYTADYDAFYVKLNSSGGLLVNTFLGGSGLEKAYGFAKGDNNDIYVSGYGNGTWDNPIRSYLGGNDAFVAKVKIENAPLIVSSVTRNGAILTNAASVDFTVTFSEPVKDVDTGDFALTTIGVITGATVSGVSKVSGSDNTYTVSVNTGSGEGTIRLDVRGDASIINDSSTPTLLSGGFMSGQTYTINKSFTPASLIAPKNDIGTNYDPTYTWNKVAPATHYRLTVSGPSGVVIDQWYESSLICGATTCSVVLGPSATLGGGSYNWSVQTWNAVNSYGPWSATWSFTTTIPSVPAAATSLSPGTVSPATPADIGTNYTPTYSWDKITGATYYRLYVVGPGNVVIKDQWYKSSEICPDATCSVVSPELGSGSYNWSVLTWNSVGYGPWSATTTFTTTTTAPTIAQNLSPTGSQGTNYTPTFTWDNVIGATYYRLYINGPSGLVLDKWYPSSTCNGATCTVDKPVTVGSGSYNWWVQTWNIAGYGPWSATANFTTTMPTVPTIAQNLAPTGSLGTNYTPTFTWDDGTGATSYRLYINGPSGLVLDNWYYSTDICSGGTCTVAKPVTVGSGSYNWWVQTWNLAGYGPWSATATFTTTMPTIPTIAQNLAPTGSQRTNYTPTFTWDIGTGATSYRLYINGPSGLVLDKWYYSTDICNSETCTVDKPVTVEGGSYNWWVQTWNLAGYGPWSATATFTTTFPSIPAGATNLSPSGTTNHIPTYTWTKVNMATWYRLYVKGPSGVVLDQWYQCHTATCSVVSPTLESGAHTWWVQTWNTAGYGPWKSATFTVSP
jgi:hypothetical protein